MQEDSKKKFKIVTLGCRTNQYESQAYQHQLEALGFEQAAEGEKASICIVNTCTVTDSADSSSRHAIRQLIRDHGEAEILVTGCFAERNPVAVKALGVSHVVPNQDKDKLLNRIINEDDLPEFAISRFEAHTRAFVKIQDGCNSFCTYCIIPYVRGRSRSRRIDEILKEVEELIANGYKEVVLTGINIGDFDGGTSKEENPIRLSTLIRLIDRMPGLERLRVSSIDPDEVDEDLADAIINGKKTCQSMHVVLQSGSNVILKRMNRKYNRQDFFNTVDRLKGASPDFTFTTDVIVGFPGETEGDFQETLEVIKQVKFAKVHMFPYSDRPRTRSVLMPNKVSQEAIKIRKHEVLKQAERSAFELREEFLFRKMTVLIENKDDNRPNFIFGHTDNFLPVWIQNDSLQPNQLVEVELIRNTPEGLEGHLLTQNYRAVC